MFPWSLVEPKLELNQVIYGFDSPESKLLGLIFLHAICSFCPKHLLRGLCCVFRLWGNPLIPVRGQKCSVIISCAPVSLKAEIFFVSHIPAYIPDVYTCPIRGDVGTQHFSGSDLCSGTRGHDEAHHSLDCLVSPVLNLCPPSTSPISKRPHSHFRKKVYKTVQLHQLSASKNVLRLFSAAHV